MASQKLRVGASAALLLVFSINFTASARRPKYENNDISTFSFDQIFVMLDRTITCLEDTPLLTPNATFAIAQTLGFLHQAIAYVPQLHRTRKELIKIIQKRLEIFILNGLQAYPDYPGNSIWWSYYYAYNGDYQFESGRVSRNKPLDKTLSEILQDTVQSELVKKCYSDVVLYNEQSSTHRECVLNCLDDMSDFDYNSGIPPEDKAWYFGYISSLNCTNLYGNELKEYGVHFCKYVKQEVDTMVLYKHTKQFKDSLYYFNKKVLFCSSFGIPEFLSPRILSAVLKNIDCNGCVGYSKSVEDRQVLTAQTATILSETLRLILEIEYKVGKF